MENQHKMIKGYRNLTKAEIDLMNEVKSAGNDIKDILLQIESIQKGNKDNIDYEQHVECIASAKEHLRIGIMMLVRSVALPQDSI